MERLAKAREVIDPFRTYRLQMPDGSFYEATGADLIATGEASLDAFHAIERGESDEVLKAAFERLDRTL